MVEPFVPDDELLAMFFEEVDKDLSTMEEGLLLLEREPADKETIQTVFRAVHNIKGGSATLGFELIRSIAHSAESLLHGVRYGSKPLTSEMTSALMLAVDALRELVLAGFDRAALTAEQESVKARLEELRAG